MRSSWLCDLYAALFLLLGYSFFDFLYLRSVEACVSTTYNKCEAKI